MHHFRFCFYTFAHCLVLLHICSFWCFLPFQLQCHINSLMYLYYRLLIPLEVYFQHFKHVSKAFVAWSCVMGAYWSINELSPIAHSTSISLSFYMSYIILMYFLYLPQPQILPCLLSWYLILMQVLYLTE